MVQGTIPKRTNIATTHRYKAKDVDNMTLVCYRLLNSEIRTSSLKWGEFRLLLT